MGARVRVSFITLAAALAAGCTTYGNDGYGYGGVAVGLSAGYGAGYYDPWYGAPYWGWYGDYYYPGIGYYVYDTGGNRHHWNDDTRRHWTSRREGWRGRRGTAGIRENWRGFARNRPVETRSGLIDRQVLRVERDTRNVRVRGSDLRGGRRTIEAQAGDRPAARTRVRNERSAVRGSRTGARSFRNTRPD